MIHITDVAYGGNGVGRTNTGKTVFVPLSVTGDIVEIDIVKDKGSYCIGQIKNILEPSKWRVPQHCPVYGICGGCQFGHIDYPRQIEIKKSIVQNALRKYPHNLPDPVIYFGSPLGYRIRGMVRVNSGLAGFFRSTSNVFVPAVNCPVMKPSLFAKVCEFAKKYRQSGLLSLSVMENPEGEAIAFVEGENSMPCILEADPFDGVSCGDKILGMEYLKYNVAGKILAYGYGGFSQANRFLMEKFQEHAASFAANDVLELYAGSGFFTLKLSANHLRVSAFEANEQAAKLAAKHGIKITAMPAEDIAEEQFAKCNTLLVDPPREGMGKKVLANILKHLPKQIIYVSCNPMTLARDISILQNSYMITDLALFDMFPHTFHIETVTVLERIA